MVSFMLSATFHTSYLFGYLTHGRSFRFVDWALCTLSYRSYLNEASLQLLTDEAHRIVSTPKKKHVGLECGLLVGRSMLELRFACCDHPLRSHQISRRSTTARCSSRLFGQMISRDRAAVKL